MKKKILVAFLCLMTFALLGANAALATLCLNYNNVNHAEIVFTGTGNTITFPSAGAFDFHITSEIDGSSAVGLLGNIEGTFIIGAISNPAPGLEIAPVSGNGTFSIDDGAGHVLTATLGLEWISIFTYGSGGGLNAEAATNVTGIDYDGLNPDLLAFFAAGSGSNVLTFQFSPAVPLSRLVLDGAVNSTSYSGSMCLIPIPAPLVLLGSGLLGLVGLRRKLD